MIQTKSEYEDLVIKMLNLIISGQRLSKELFPECTEKDFSEILHQCVVDNIIIGYSVQRVADGNSIGQCTGTPYVTIKGLNFMDSVNQARALDVARKAEQNSVSAILKANKSFIVSIAALIATLIINADKIIHNLRAILSYLGTL